MWSVHASDALGLLVNRGGDVNLDIDATALVQVGLFVVLLFVLKPMLFDPMLKLFEEREKRIEGNIAKAREIDEESAKARSEYEAEMHKARTEGATEREKIRSEGLKQEAELLAKVRGETAKQAEAAREKAEGELAGARATLEKDTGGLAQQLAGIVLGREVRG